MHEAYRALADALGILPGFHAIDGRYQELGEGSVRALAAALGHPADDPETAGRSLAALLDARRARTIRDYQIGRAGEPIALSLPDQLAWALHDVDSGERLALGVGPDIAPSGLPAGRYRLTFPERDEPGTLLLVRPDHAPLDAWLAAGRRCWGVMAALYGLRSARNGGLGDYRDLAALATVCGSDGADFLGINPVHALRTGDAGWHSPYSPNHRGFWNTAHIALDAVPELAASPQARERLAALAPQFEALRAATLVDYPGVMAPRREILALLFDSFADLPPENPRALAFAAWRHAQGEALERFATFEALADALAGRYGPVARGWPAEFAHAGAAGVGDFAAANERAITFHAWLQFLADEQIAAVARAAGAAGMRLGLYLDVGVGTVNGSAEVWSRPAAFGTDVSLGAPPDHFNPTGQAWDLAPFHPHRLMDADGEPLVGVLRAAMRHAGMIRIDHVLGLKRSFWVPSSGLPGGYVHYPFDALLALVAIEADRAGAIVVGEDLGLVPEGLRERLAEEGLLGCTVMQFEREGDRFFDPARYRPLSIGSVGSHDVPPLCGWWIERDVDGLVAAGMIDGEEAEAMRAARAGARRGLWRLLDEHDLLPEGAAVQTPPERLEDPAARAVHALLARSPVVFAAIQLDDVLGVSGQQNLPGTVREHPNWRRRVAPAIEALAADARWRGHSALMASLRPRRA